MSTGVHLNGQSPSAADERTRLHSPTSATSISALNDDVEYDVTSPTQYTDSPLAPPKSAKARGKQKAVVPSEEWDDDDGGSAVDEGIVMGRTRRDRNGPTSVAIEEEQTRLSSAVDDAVSPSERYPPMNDEDVESKKVEENLKRWELVEKQRRKAARESRASIAPPTLLGDVARRASGIFNPASVATVNGRPVSRSRSLRESFMSGKEDMVGGGSSRRRPTTNDSANYVELGSDGPPGLGGVKEGPDEEDDDVGTIVNGDYDLGVTGSPPSTRKTRRSHTARRSSAGSVDTFATTRSGPENPFSSQHGQIPLDEPFTPPRQPVSQQPQSTHLQVPQPTKATRNRKGKSKTAPLPAPQPLDLPAADYHSQQPPSSEMSHWRRVQEDRILAELEEEEEIDRRSGGRWWTDWLCGCREGGRGSRDDQAGRTNPFE